MTVMHKDVRSTSYMRLESNPLHTVMYITKPQDNNSFYQLFMKQLHLLFFYFIFNFLPLWGRIIFLRTSASIHLLRLFKSSVCNSTPVPKPKLYYCFLGFYNHSFLPLFPLKSFVFTVCSTLSWVCGHGISLKCLQRIILSFTLETIL